MDIKEKKKKITKRKVFTFCIIAIPVIFIICSGVFKEYLSSKMEWLEVAYYVSQIISVVILTASAAVAVWQYYIVSKDSVRELRVIQVQKAIDLSAYYKDNILNKYQAVWYVFEETGIKEILDKIKLSDMKRFDKKELEKNLSEGDRKKLEEIQKSQKFSEAILNANTIYNLNLNIQKQIHDIKKDENGNNIVQIDVAAKPLLVSFMSEMISDLLNNMEFFAMHFYHKAADDTVVYRSLHQTYFDIVRLMYYNISNKNVSVESMYYTHVIDLYLKWYKFNQEEIDKISSHKLEKGTQVE